MPDQNTILNTQNIKIAEKEQKTNDIQQCLDEEQKQSKKRKNNQRKKRQREKKKKQNQFQNGCNEYEDFNGDFISQNGDYSKYMSAEQLDLLRQQDFDPQEFIEDEQLLILIQQYDPAMNQSDIEYLMQLEDREAVINTLYAKLMEREHQQLQLIDQDNRNDDDFDEDEDEEDSQENNYISLQTYREINQIQNSLSPLNLNSKQPNSNLLQVPNYNTTSELKNSKSQKCKQKNQVSNNAKDKKQQGLANQSSMKNQSNQKLANSQSKKQQQNVSYNKNNNCNQLKDDQVISFEEEQYDKEFEKELQEFKKKIQPKEECSLERTYCCQQVKANSSAGKNSKKLVPNVSTEWILYLKSQLNKINLNKANDKQSTQNQGSHQYKRRQQRGQQEKARDSSF